jgi:hypothetical protein
MTKNFPVFLALVAAVLSTTVACGSVAFEPDPSKGSDASDGPGADASPALGNDGSVAMQADAVVMGNDAVAIKAEVGPAGDVVVNGGDATATGSDASAGKMDSTVVTADATVAAADLVVVTADAIVLAPDAAIEAGKVDVAFAVDLSASRSDGGRKNMKGWELYSWVTPTGLPGWCFSLMEGTNRCKTVAEIESADNELFGCGVNNLKSALAQIAPGQDVLWWIDSPCLDPGVMSLPDQATVDEVEAYAAELGLVFRISGG